MSLCAGMVFPLCCSALVSCIWQQGPEAAQLLGNSELYKAHLGEMVFRKVEKLMETEKVYS